MFAFAEFIIHLFPSHHLLVYFTFYCLFSDLLDNSISPYLNIYLVTHFSFHSSLCLFRFAYLSYSFLPLTAFHLFNQILFIQLLFYFISSIFICLFICLLFCFMCCLHLLFVFFDSFLFF